ncbi:MAG: tcrA [Actinomycetia bacterium]|nr:tcrA [Actinomycetes bacterium]
MAGLTPYVLVVEDDPKMATIVERCLQRASYATEVATSGDQALWAVLNRSPIAIVLDVMIPHPSGIEVCKHLRREGWTGPIVIVSARSSPADRDVALRAGADAFMAKPFVLAELLATIEALTSRSHRIDT